jgi:hypothetical protein
MLVGLWGCGKASVTIPDNYGIPGGSPPPPATIVPADANSHADLVRENQQLRARVAWLENQNRRSSGKYESLAKDEDEIRADMKKIAAERDRYRKEAGQ